tara:strand:- start:493 stop:1143 length:651 start_codon:yes stop_codon:yes gene_type:complete
MEILVNFLIKKPLFLNIMFLTMAGIVIRQSLVIVGQRWANTYHHLGTYILLPSIALVLTSVIRGDLALSLGMVGALSIVRFRNPVKSPFELIMFFALLTLGVTCNVSLDLSFKLFLLVVLVILGIKIADRVFSIFSINIFQYSFGDGNLTYTLELNTSEEVDDILQNKNVIYFFFDKEKNIYSYRLVFKNQKELLNYQSLLKKEKRVLSIRADMQS